jgi:hypothetical protein
VDQEDKIKRITFSRSLAEHIVKSIPDQRLRILRATFVIGKDLKSGQPSSNGLYAIASRKTSAVLRISLIKELAYLITDDSRYVAECFITDVEDA